MIEFTNIEAFNMVFSDWVYFQVMLMPAFAILALISRN